jgi:hypothetical protein
VEAAIEQHVASAPAKAKLARGFVLAVAFVAATTILFASWDQYGSAFRRESMVARKEIKDTMRSATKPLRKAWRDARRALRSL